MSEFLLTLLSLSVSGALIALLLLAIKPIVRYRLSQSWQYYIYLIVILRLLVPISPGPNFIGGWFERVVPPAERVINRGADIIVSGIAGTHAPTALPMLAKQMQAQTSVWEMLWIVWFIGAAAMFIWKGYGYMRFRGQFSAGHRTVTQPNVLAMLDDCRRELQIGARVPLYRNALAPTPMLFGLLRPAIVLPDNRNYDENELRYIFLHELTHFKRRDLWYKWLAQLTQCLHWFNPVVYLAVREIDRACELSCDEAVIKRLSPKEKQGYGNTLIAMAASGSYRPAAGARAMSEEKRHLKERLTAIMKSGKRSAAIAIVSFALATLIGCGALFTGSFVQDRARPSGEPESGKVYAGYNLEEIAKDRTKYVGDNSKVLHLVEQLPAPDPYYVQRYIALQTSQQPYGLTAFYEPDSGANDVPPRPDHGPNSKLADICRQNALVLFAMIDNVDEITFAFRSGPSTGQLDQSAYDAHLTFLRSDFARHVDFNEIAVNIEKLGQLLENWDSSFPD
ncbi:M56 family metallopeptidase [Paenibacillus sp. MSJ-34]|uniref:M56 family metallopeptidase n=1 Tax=Paenibacillus sp. MSJ-34 TaxID=2841529 RepID=UPI001C10948D|nr:M56 family metallopeptidase [Paenibacillus sp. MSJ-34]MBU5443651.1 DUF4825 domain-containing protein [Paenibacillus sp. MSJ-34]